MILFQKDYLEYGGVPHLTTRNVSFIKMYLVMKQKGIRNNMFHLALTQPELADIDPHNLKDPSPELVGKIAHECKVNPWYYFREIVRIPAQGSQPIPFELHRGNLALIWAFYNNINTFLVLPRQHYKTMSTQGIMSNLMFFRCENFTIAMLTKDYNLVVENCSRLREIRNALPQWLLLPNGRGPDTDNKEGLSYTTLGTKYLTFLNQQDPYSADRLGRGMTTPCQHWDEIAYFKNVDISYPSALSATDKAVESARRVGMPHANILTTTAGRLDSPEGGYVYNEIVNKAMTFTEALYDCENHAELASRVKANSKNYMLYIVFSYKQLGRSQEWIQEKLDRADGDRHKFDRDYLNIWTAGVDNGLIPPQLIQKIKESERDPLYVEMLDDYVIRWYVAPEIVLSPKFQKKPLIAGLDTSENVGRDFTSMAIVDPSDMSLVATMRCNESNLIRFALCTVELLIRFENLILVPEKKITAIPMIDMIIIELQKRKINPFTRIFNRIVQNRHDEFTDVDIYDPRSAEGVLRKHFGFVTAGAGAQARTVLYKTVMMKTLNMNHSRIYDSTLIMELAKLTVKNGRLDHASGNHDDMVVAYLLACYFVFFGQNLSYYGINEKEFLSRISTTGEEVDPHQRQAQDALKDRIYLLEQAMNRCQSHTIRLGYQREWNYLQSLLDQDATPEPIAKDQLVQEEQRIRNAPLDMTRLGSVFQYAF